MTTAPSSILTTHDRPQSRVTRCSHRSSTRAVEAVAASAWDAAMEVVGCDAVNAAREKAFTQLSRAPLAVRTRDLVHHAVFAVAGSWSSWPVRSRAVMPGQALAHATAYYAVTRSTERCTTDPAYAADFARILALARADSEGSAA